MKSRLLKYASFVTGHSSNLFCGNNSQPPLMLCGRLKALFFFFLNQNQKSDPAFVVCPKHFYSIHTAIKK